MGGATGASFEPQNINASFGHVAGIFLDVAVKCLATFFINRYYYSSCGTVEGDTKPTYRNTLATYVGGMSSFGAKEFYFASHIFLDYYQQKMSAATPTISGWMYTKMCCDSKPGWGWSSEETRLPSGVVYWFAGIETAVADARVRALWGDNGDANYSQKRGALLTLAQSANTRPDWEKLSRFQQNIGNSLTVLFWVGGFAGLCYKKKETILGWLSS